MTNDDPPEKDMKDFEFIQLCKLRVSQSRSEFSPNRSQLLASSSQYGLLFFATDDESPCFQVVKTSELLAIDQRQGKDRTKVTVTDFPVEAKVPVPSPIEFLCISADDLTLAVVVKEAGQLIILFYDVRCFGNKPTSVLPFAKSNVNAGAIVSVVDIAWNPAVSAMLVICLSDGSMQLMEVIAGAKVIASLPAPTGATCFSWSPKGKQLLVGKKDGSLAQYDHSLAEKKKWTCPTVFQCPQTVVDVVWISTYSFIAGYLSVGAQSSEQPLVVLTQSNKENNTKYINFEDPCFGNGEEVTSQFLFHFVQKWEMVILASSRATEATVIGKNLDDKVSWEHWNLDDCSRAELPLTSSQSDSYPLGLAVDYSPQNQVVISETKTLPACPIMFILSSDGLLLSYHLSYTHREAPPVNIVPQSLDPSAARKGVPGLVSVTTQRPTGSAGQAPVAQQSASSSMPFAAFSAPEGNQGLPLAGMGSVKPEGDFFSSGQQKTQSLQPPPYGSSPYETSQSSSLVAPSSTTTPSFSFSTTGQAAGKGQTSAFVSFSAASTSASASAQPAQGLPSLHLSQSLLPKPNIPAQAHLHPKPVTVPDQPSAVPPQLPGGIPPSPSAGIFGFAKKSDGSQAEGIMHQNANGVKAASQNRYASPPQTQNRFTAPPESRFAAPSQNRFAPPSQGRFPAPTLSSTPAHQPAPSRVNVATAPQGQSSMRTPLPAYTGQQSDTGTSQQIRELGIPGASPQGEESKKAIKATVDSAFTQNITEEIIDFEQEMRDLINRTKHGVKAVGSRAELQSLRQDAEKMSNFLAEMKDATQEQSTESKELKSNCYNLLYMAEECSTLHQRNSDPHYHSLLQGRALDPVTADKLKSLQQMAQSIETTVIDVDHVLDSQWNEHLSKGKERMTTGAGDTIYKNIKNNHWLISDQQARMAKLEDQIRSLKFRPKAKNVENENALNLLSRTSQALQDIKASPSARAAVNMTPEKVSRLKDYLLQRKVPVVKSTSPADLSLSRIVSQSAKKASPSTAILKTATPQREQHLQAPSRQQSTPRTRFLPGSVNQQYHQTPTGIPSAQLRLAKGDIPEPTHATGVAAPFGFGQPPPTSQVAPDSGFLQKADTPPQVPTAFSGVAYFKQPHTAPSAAMGQGMFARQPIPAEVQAAAQVLSTHMGSAMRPDGPLAHIPQLLSAAAAAGSGGGIVGGGGKPLPQHEYYENITPTETDETNDEDDDDDYDEEDNGYEDEDEDEDDEAVLRPDMRHGALDQLDSRLAANSSGISAQSLGRGASSVASNNLFGVKVPSPGQGAAGQGSPPAESGTKADGKPFVFSPPKFGCTAATAAFDFGLKPGMSSAASSSSAAPSMPAPSAFSGKPSTNKPAFSFGASTSFGQKGQSNPATTTTGTASVFGSLATPSKSVGFGDPAPVAGSPEETENSPSVQQKTAVTAATSSGDNKSAKDVSGGGIQGDTTPSPTASSPSSTATPISASASGSSATTTGFSFAPSNADSAKAGSSLFAPQTKVPSSSDEASKLSPFASAPAQTGFSIFAGNKAASPPGSKSGFDAVFSATSPPVATTADSSGFSFSQSTNSASSPSGLFAAKPVNGSDPLPSSTTTHLQGNATSEESTTPTPTPLSASAAMTTSSTSAASPTSSVAVSSKEETPNLFSSSTPKLSQQDESAISSSSLPSVSSSSTSQTSSLTGSAAQSSSVASDSPTSFSSFAFGSKGAATSSIPPTFGTKSLTTTTTAASATMSSLFGNSGDQTTTTAPNTSAFGGAVTSLSSSATAPASGSVTASSSSSAGSVFGATLPSATSSADTPGFGMTSSVTSLFGAGSTGESLSAPKANLLSGSSTPGTAASSASSFSGSAFGAKSLFGTPSSTSASLFGGAGDVSSTATSSLFGGSSATPSTSGPSFGFGATSQASSGGLFGALSSASDTPSTGSLFSKPATSGGLFGSSSSSGPLFGATSAPAANASQTGSVFGQPSSSGSAVGFGQSQPAASSSLFGGGGADFGLGGKPSEEKAKLNVFGSASQTFGAENTVTDQNSLFGSGSSSTFGAVGNSSGSSFGGVAGGFSSSSGGGVSATGFGVSSATNSPGFGSNPTFGGTPSFGSPGFGSGFGGSKPAFGSSPSFGAGSGFGATPAFGSPAAPAGPFNPASNQASGFGSFASASAPSFGQLAQSSPNNTFGSPPTGFGSTQPMAPGFGGAGAGVGGAVAGGGGGASGFGSFGASPGFGQSPAAAPFGADQNPSFGNTSFGSSPAFSSYRG